MICGTVSFATKEAVDPRPILHHHGSSAVTAGLDNAGTLWVYHNAYT